MSRNGHVRDGQLGLTINVHPGFGNYGFAHHLMLMSPGLSKACVFGVRRLLDLPSSHRIRGHKSASSGFPTMVGGSEKGQGHSEEPPL